MTTSNPLVAAPGRASSTAGAMLVDSVWRTACEIDNGTAADVGIHGAVAALDLLGTVIDPLQSLAAAGVGWLMEHCEPLRWPLDQLAGNPQAVNAVSQTWHNIAAEMGAVSADVAAATANDTRQWHGAAADAYRDTAAQLADEIGAMQAGASALAGAVTTGGALVGTVRGLIRDVVANVVGDLIAKALVATASSFVTLGGSVGAFIAWAVGKIGITIGRIAEQISQLLTRLGELLGRVNTLGGHLGELATSASRYVRVRGVKMDQFAAAPGRWVSSGAPHRWGAASRRGYDRITQVGGVVDDQLTRTSLQAMGEAQAAPHRYDEQQRQAGEEFGGSAR